MFVLSYVLPPVDGAAFGKATVLSPVPRSAHAAIAMSLVLQQRGQFTHTQAKRLALSLVRAETGTEWTEPETGITFRIDPEDRAPNACPCCGRLVKWGDHAFAGSDDAYCLGCYTWGDSAKISCDPQHTAHANPWTTNATDARWHMHVVIDHDGETGDDDRYATDKPEGHRELWDDEDNALIAWPGLTRDQIISVTITEINKES